MLTLGDFFCGAGGSSYGATRVKDRDGKPLLRLVLGANHWRRAIETHVENFPESEHFLGDIREIDVARLPHFDLFQASPECPQWSQANGKRSAAYRTQDALPGLEPVRDVEAERSRALMEEVPLYLAAQQRRGKLVLGGVVENVIQVRDWVHFQRWIGEFHLLGYRTRIIAMNSAHAWAPGSPRAPQYRDRFYMAYWHSSLGRDPDWDKWLRPRSWCAGCDAEVDAVQVFKDPTRDMGRYRAQYYYACPRGHGQLEPYVLPAAAAIDWALPGQRIGDRDKPLAEKTMERIRAGIEHNRRPITLQAAGHTFERRPGVRTRPVEMPVVAQTATASTGVAVPPLIVPVEGRPGKSSTTVDSPARTQTARAETALAVVPPMLVPAGGTWRTAPSPLDGPMPTRTTSESDMVVVPPLIMRNHTPRHGESGGYMSVPVGSPCGTLTASNTPSLLVSAPFIAELRGGGSTWRPVSDSAATVTASGNHHGLCVPPAGPGSEREIMEFWARVYAYDTGELHSPGRPLPTQTAVSGDALLQAAAELAVPDVDDVLFRMLEPREIHRAMAFAETYIVTGNRREQVRQLGNAVTPPVAELLFSALVEAVTGEDIERTYYGRAA